MFTDQSCFDLWFLVLFLFFVLSSFASALAKLRKEEGSEEREETCFRRAKRKE